MVTAATMIIAKYLYTTYDATVAEAIFEALGYELAAIIVLGIGIFCYNRLVRYFRRKNY